VSRAFAHTDTDPFQVAYWICKNVGELLPGKVEWEDLRGKDLPHELIRRGNYQEVPFLTKELPEKWNELLELCHDLGLTLSRDAIQLHRLMLGSFPLATIIPEEPAAPQEPRTASKRKYRRRQKSAQNVENSGDEGENLCVFILC
jgi:hypothetical protein